MRRPGGIFFISIILAVFLCSSQANAQRDAETTIVKAGGTARMTGDDRAYARKKAIDAALHNAVKSVIDATLSKDMVLEQSSFIENVLYKDSRNYIQEYRIVEEAVDDGLYSVTVSASVLSEKIKDKFKNPDLSAPSSNVMQTSVVSFTVRGIDSCAEYIVLKNYFKNKKSHIINIYEYIFEAGVVHFKIELLGTPSAFAEELSSAHIPGLLLAVRNVTTDGIDTEILR